MPHHLPIPYSRLHISFALIFLLFIAVVGWYMFKSTTKDKSSSLSHITLPPASKTYISKGSIKYIMIIAPAAKSMHTTLLNEDGEYIAGDEMQRNAIKAVKKCDTDTCSVAFNRWLDDITFILNVLESNKNIHEVSMDALSGSVVKAD